MLGLTLALSGEISLITVVSLIMVRQQRCKTNVRMHWTATDKRVNDNNSCLTCSYVCYGIATGTAIARIQYN